MTSPTTDTPPFVPPDDAPDASRDPTETTQNARSNAEPDLYLFYETMPSGQPLPFWGKIALSLVLGLFFWGLHGLTTGLSVTVQDGNFVFTRTSPLVTMMKDESWLIGLMLLVTPLTLYYGSHVLRQYCHQMIRYLDEAGERRLRKTIADALSKRRFLLSGLGFGIINVGLIWGFGIPYDTVDASITYLFGVFLIGFVCGFPACGIYAVIVITQAWARENTVAIDLTSPDGRGGLKFVGDALIRFASVTLLVGVLIAICITRTDWQNASLDWSSGEALLTSIGGTPPEPNFEEQYLLLPSGGPVPVTVTSTGTDGGKRIVHSGEVMKAMTDFIDDYRRSPFVEFCIAVTVIGWTVFPFVLALLILLRPAFFVHERLHQFKVDTDWALKERLEELRTFIQDSHTSPSDLESLKEEYQRKTDLRTKLHAMQTWPFSVLSVAQFSAILLANTLLSNFGLNADVVTLVFGML